MGDVGGTLKRIFLRAIYHAITRRPSDQSNVGGFAESLDRGGANGNDIDG
jgi:hypothetical protein